MKHKTHCGGGGEGGYGGLAAALAVPADRGKRKGALLAYGFQEIGRSWREDVDAKTHKRVDSGRRRGPPFICRTALDTKKKRGGGARCRSDERGPFACRERNQS